MSPGWDHRETYISELRGSNHLSQCLAKSCPHAGPSAGAEVDRFTEVARLVPSSTKYNYGLFYNVSVSYINNIMCMDVMRIMCDTTCVFNTCVVKFASVVCISVRIVFELYSMVSCMCISTCGF